jgi:hypothetical protein
LILTGFFHPVAGPSGQTAVEVYQVNHRHHLKDEQQGQPVMVWELVPCRRSSILPGLPAGYFDLDRILSPGC